MGTLVGSREQEYESRLNPQASDRYLQPSDIHVLLVDDEHLSRLVVGNLLRKCNYKVTVVESGPQALEILRRSVPGTFQLILTDVMMPEVDGLDLLRYVRSNSQLVDLPVIMMSANEHKLTVFEAIKGGAEEYLVKPVTRKEVQNIWQYVWKRLTANQPLIKGEGHTSGVLSMERAAAAAAPPPPPPAPTLQQQQLWQQHQHQQQLPHRNSSTGALPNLLLQPQQQQQQQLVAQAAAAAAALNRRAASPPAPAAAAAAATAMASTSVSSKTSKVLLSRWLQRPNRVIDPKESVWVFCEVLLLLERAQQAAGAAGLPPGCVRPSRLLLHSSGRVTFAGPPGATGATMPGCEGLPGAGGVDAEEEQLYRSPEEAAAAASAAAAAGGSGAGDGISSSSNGSSAFSRICAGAAAAAAAVAALGPKCDSFSLGVLFFDLFWAAPGSSRAQCIQDLRQRILPPAFLLQRPQEAAFTLALLHPDPDVRPSVQELLKGDLLGSACEAVRAKRAAQEQAEQANDAQGLLFFLRTMQVRKQAEADSLQMDVSGLDASIEAVMAALGQVQRVGISGNDLGVGAEEAAAGASSATAAAVAEEGSEAAAALSGSNQQQQEGGCSDGGAPPSCQRQQQQEQRCSSARRSRDEEEDEDEDDREERRREMRGKRRKIGPGFDPARFSSPPLPPLPAAAVQMAPAAPAAAPAAGTAGDAVALEAAKAGAAGFAVPPTLLRQWERLSRNIGDLQMLFFRRKEQWEQQQQQKGVGTPAGGGGLPALAVAASAGEESPPAAAEGGRKEATEALPGYLQSYCEDLHKYTQYNRLTVRGYSKSSGDVLGGSALICGVAFDRDDEFFATAGVSKRIRIYEYASLLGQSRGGVHYPLLDITSRSRLSSVVWSSYVKSQLASSDYEGVVQLWDASGNQEVVQFEEHAKRAWAVDFSTLDPSRLLSGSDDGTIKLWSIHQESSCATIDVRANVCSVQFSPDDPHLIAAGSANYLMYLFDLRNTSAPLAVGRGHNKAVSYVRFLGGQELVTASTDNTLRLWSLPAVTSPLDGGGLLGAGGMQQQQQQGCELVFRGHTNERNFIGLGVSPAGYIACGSETNEVFTYYKAVPLPVAQHQFQQGADMDLETMSEAALGGGPGQFVSCVAWSKRYQTLLAANSAGHIKVLELV